MNGNYCDNHHNWSNAFASRLCDSISDSDILGYFTAELNEEHKFSSSDVNTARMYEVWHDFFALKYKEMDAFLLFYYSLNRILHKLKNEKSVTVTDDVFVNSYCVKATETPELQHEVKYLLKRGAQPYAEILELIHVDYRSQDTGERIRDSVTASSTIARGGKAGGDLVMLSGVVDVNKMT